MNEGAGIPPETQSGKDWTQNLGNRTLIFTTLEWRPWIVKLGEGRWSGICMDLLEEMSEALNFSYIYVEPPDGAWGIHTGNGTYNGMIGMVKNKKADLGAGPFTVTEERHVAVDFLSPLFIDNYVLVMRKPNATGRNFFLLPYEGIVWVTVVVAILISATFVLVFERWSERLVYGRQLEKHRPAYNYEIFMYIWSHVNSLLGHGMIRSPRYLPSRMMVGCWWFVVIAFVASYTGNMVANLSVRDIHLPVTTLEDLSKSTKSVVMVANTAIHGVFKNAKSGIMKEVYDRKLKHDRTAVFLGSDAETLRRVYDDAETVSITEYQTIKYLYHQVPSLNKHKCLLSVSEVGIYKAMGAMIMRKGNPLYDTFNTMLLKMLENGMLKHIASKYERYSECTGYERSERSGDLTIKEVVGIFLLMAGGLLVACAVLVLENIVCRMNKHRAPENDKLHQTLHPNTSTNFRQIKIQSVV